MSIARRWSRSGRHVSTRIVLKCLLLGVAVLGARSVRGADEQVDRAIPIRFGILPIGSAAESLEQWRPLLDDLRAQLGHPVTTVSVGNYASLSDAIGAQRVDIAFLSGKLAVEAVTRQHMQVFAQFVRSDGVRGNVAMLVVRGDGPIGSLDELLEVPGRWSYARSEHLSVTGYTAPEAFVFAPRGLNSDTFFGRVEVGGHQDNLLRVVNHEVDVASSNNPDMDLFRRNFPREAAQLQVIWRSRLIPSGVLVMRQGVPGPLRERLTAFLLAYGHAPGAAGERQRNRLARVLDLGGFAPETNRVLQPFVDMQHALRRARALHSQWVSPQARQMRLDQIERDYQRDTRMLTQSQ